MALRAHCNCGRSVSADDVRAGRDTACPVCGGVVPIRSVPTRGERPSVLKVSFITGDERDSRAGRSDPIETQVNIGSHSPAPPGGKPRRRRLRKENWRDSLWVPIQHIGFLVKLSAGSAAAAVFCAVMLHGDLGDGGISLRFLGAFVLLLLPVAAVACELLYHVVAEASRVQTDRDRWIDPVTPAAGLSLNRWALCFLCGPAMIFALAAWHWTNCGDVGWLDRIILIEILAVGGGYWALQILLTSGNRPLSGLLPGPVLKAGCTVGWRFVPIAGLFGLVLAGGGSLGMRALAAASLGNYWTAVRLWFLLTLIGLSGAGILLDYLGAAYARRGEPLPDDTPRPAQSAPLPIPEALPESSLL